MPNITIATTAAALNQYSTTFAPTIAQGLKQELEFERLLPFRTADRTYVRANVSVNRALQPYQPDFTPNNAESFDAVENTLQPGKVDLQFTQADLEEFFDAWMINWFELGKPATEWSYPRYILENHIMPQLMEDINLASWAGQRVNPTAGTAGTYLQSWDGYKKKIADAITAGKLTPIATGAPASGSMVEWIREFCHSLPTPYRFKAGKIYMSATNASRYSEDYAEKYPRASDVINNPNAPVVRVDHFNKTVVGINAMEGSDRIFFSPDITDNIIVVSKRGMPAYPVFRFQEFDRTLKVLSEMSRAYGFEYWDHLFVNDQA